MQQQPLIPLWQLLMLLLLLSWPAYNLALAAFGSRRARPRAGTGSGAGRFVFWLVIPAMNEELVIERTVRSALALDTPATPVRVLVVDDASEDRTPGILSGIDDPRLQVLRRDLPDARAGKGEALNAAYRLIREAAERDGDVHRTVIGVIDADGRTDRASMREVADLLAESGVGACQMRVRIYNRERLLGLLQDMEFACVASAAQVVRDLNGSVGLGGNGQFVTLPVLLPLGDAPWSSCLVEDLEIGLRMHTGGTSIRYTRAATVIQQAVTDPRRLVRQRTRWAQGNLQCSRYIPELLRSRWVGSVGLLDFLQYLITPWLAIPVSVIVSAVLGVTVLGTLAGWEVPGLVTAGGTVWLALAVWLVVGFIPGIMWAFVHRLSIRDEPLWRCIMAGILYPFFLLLGIVAAWRAVYRHLTGHGKWDKTERVAA